MFEVQVRCKDCRGYGRDTWTYDAEVSALKDEVFDAVFYPAIFAHHEETHKLNTQNTKADGGDNEYDFYLGTELIGYAAVSSAGKNFLVNG